MEFLFTNKQELFNCINNLNQKYYKPADKYFKICEDYSRRNAAGLLEYFRDAHDCLVKATLVKDIVSQKNEIEQHLEKYVKELQKLLIKEYCFLLNHRVSDLLSSPLLPSKKTEKKDNLRPRWNTLNAIAHVDDNAAIEELDRVIEEFEKHYEFVETLY